MPALRNQTTRTRARDKAPRPGEPAVERLARPARSMASVLVCRVHDDGKEVIAVSRPLLVEVDDVFEAFQEACRRKGYDVESGGVVPLPKPNGWKAQDRFGIDTLFPGDRLASAEVMLWDHGDMPNALMTIVAEADSAFDFPFVSALGEALGRKLPKGRRLPEANSETMLVARIADAVRNFDSE